MESKIAIITGVAGQDGSYLSEILLEKGYKVVGLVRRSGSSPKHTFRINHLMSNPNFRVVEGDITDSEVISKRIREIKPNEIYNLAAQSHVGTSFEHPWSTHVINHGGFVHIMEAVKEFSPATKVYQAGSSEQFGASTPPQNEQTPFLPVSPYGVSKVASFLEARYYRNRGLFVACGILYNHESPRRGSNFVTKKIVENIVRIIRSIKLGQKPEMLRLGNLDSYRDWGFSKEYMEAAWRIVQHSEPDDFIIATNTKMSVKEFLEETIKVTRTHFGYNDETLPLENVMDYVVIDPGEVRQSELWALQGDYSKAKKLLGWQPTIFGRALIQLMVGGELYGE